MNTKAAKLLSSRQQALSARPERPQWGTETVRPARAAAAVTIGLVGGGRGGAVLLDLLNEWTGASVAVVIDPRPDAQALRTAKALGIPTAPHHLAVFSHPIDVVLEVTGRADVLDDLLRAKPSHVEVIGAASLRFFWSLLQSRAEAAHQLRVQLDLAMALQSSLDSKRQIMIATQKLAQACGVDRCGFLLLDEATGFVTPVTSQFATGESDERLWSDFKRLGHLPLTSLPFVSAAIERREPIEIDDPVTSPLLPAGWAELFGVKSVLVLPMFRTDRPIGVCLLDYCRDGRRFTAEQIALGATLASQVSLAIENTQLHQRAAQRAEKLTTLSKLTQVVTSIQAGEQVFREIAKAAVTLLGAKIAQVWVDDAALGVLRIQGGFGLDPVIDVPLLEVSEIPRGQGVIASVFQSREAEYLVDVQEDARWLNRQLARQRGLHAFAAIPLMTEERVTGALAILFDTRRVFSPEERELMHLLAGQAAVALENVRLYAEARTQLRRTQTLLAIGQTVGTTLDLTETLRRVTTETRQALGADMVGAYLADEEECVLRPIAGTGVPADLAQAFTDSPLPLRGHRFFEDAWKDGRAVWSDDSATDSRIDREVFARFPQGSAAFVPMIGKDRPIGGLFLLWRTCRPALAPEELLLAEGICRQAAIAVANARLYDEARHMLEELRATQEQLTQAQRMDAIGQLAGGIAHDFNNLLTVIMGRSHLLGRDPRAVDSIRRGLEVIDKTAKMAADLTRQLLAFSRKQMLQPKVLDLNTVVSNTNEVLRRLIGEDIALNTALDPAIGSVKADPGQIEQILVNLAVNARDAMRAGGQLTIETANVELDAHDVGRYVGARPGPHVMLTVSDTGVGMSRETVAHVFEPFFTTKEIGKGTGLGLSIVYGIVKQSGGWICVSSEPGAGSIFKIYFPREQASAEKTEGALTTSADVPRGSETILLVEDEGEVRALAREILQARGYTVLEAPGGAEALRIGERHPGVIHLMLTDVVMPGIGGRELANRLNAVRPGMAVLYMSGYTDNPDVHHGMLESGSAFLQKPMAPDILLREVRELLDQRPVTTARGA